MYITCYKCYYYQLSDKTDYYQYLDGSVYVGFLASKVDQTSNSDTI